MNEQKPSVGRVVHYFPAEGTDPPHNNSTILPAMIVRVWGDECVNLKVLNDGAQDFWVTSSTKGDQAHQWNWPPRV